MINVLNWLIVCFKLWIIVKFGFLVSVIEGLRFMFLVLIEMVTGVVLGVR